MGLRHLTCSTSQRWRKWLQNKHLALLHHLETLLRPKNVEQKLNSSDAGGPLDRWRRPSQSPPRSPQASPSRWGAGGLPASTYSLGFLLLSWPGTILSRPVFSQSLTSLLTIFLSLVFRRSFPSAAAMGMPTHGSISDCEFFRHGPPALIVSWALMMSVLVTSSVSG